jgi:hypothetical protein
LQALAEVTASREDATGQITTRRRLFVLSRPVFEVLGWSLSAKGLMWPVVVEAVYEGVDGKTEGSRRGQIKGVLQQRCAERAVL